jgi:glycosyltransferase involved in cell wall biosynthesis
VVWSDIGGVQDFAFDGRTALLVRPRDAAALAAAMQRMIDQPSLRAGLARNALSEVERFDWDRATGEFLDLLYARTRCQRAGAGAVPR